MKKRNIAAMVTSMVVAVFVIASLMVWPIGMVYADGPALLSPSNGALGCPVHPVSFSWSPYKETTKYRFVLARDAAMTQVIAEADVSATAYEYEGTLDTGTNYFWHVMAVEPPSDWSATFSFQTEGTPPPPPPPPPPDPCAWVPSEGPGLEWSPNGKQIAFVKMDDNRHRQIYVLDVRNGKIRQLTDYDADSLSPTWSPASDRIAFLSLRGGTCQIYEIKLSSGKISKLTNIK